MIRTEVPETMREEFEKASLFFERKKEWRITNMYLNFFHADSYSYTSINCNMEREEMLRIAKRTGLNIGQIIDAVRILMETPVVTRCEYIVPNCVTEKSKTGRKWDISIEDGEKPEREEGYVDMLEESGALEAMRDA